ncbi:hypothetical protein [Clostridium folliculivorans]|uniref:Uncharacterized protein n=1 Tax=Clostridium folliculivorans TaxID=2886038 RepID=A0A9W5Y2Y0_9CLOT|nr:hypothetical protein [Clostridium folliculivorans]GKU25646.1 hypothetical protein CFOLD11_24720 [Clostridium folliculivorans]GKU28668.1 hypothetical protein CFB3_07740 [Clostridium folliculivorans]
MFTITGIIVILCVYQLFNIGRNVLKISAKIRTDFKVNTLRDELNKLTEEEYIEWCIDYLKRKKYNYVRKLDDSTIVCNIDGEKIYVSCVKAEELNKKNIYKLLGLKGINRINKLATLSNASEQDIDKETLRDFHKLGIELIGIGEFDISYEEYVRNNRFFA